MTLGPCSPPGEHSSYDPVMGNAVESGYFCDPIVRSNQSINAYFSGENTKPDCEEKPVDHRKPWWRWRPQKQSEGADGEEQIAPRWRCPLPSRYVCARASACSLVLLSRETPDLLFSTASYLRSHSPEAVRETDPGDRKITQMVTQGGENKAIKLERRGADSTFNTRNSL